MADNKAIKFPKKHYVGFQARPSVDDLPLAFMTPDGDDAAAKKRKSTVDNWASGHGYDGTNTAKDKLPAQSYDNNPMIGFKLGRNVSHSYGWGQGNVKWRIADPRGFELEISSPNLAQIMGFCNIEKGEIQEECIWARLGADNILVPVNSDVYEASARNTERMSKKASMRDLKIGDTAILHNGDEGIYYGAFYVAAIDTYRTRGDAANTYVAGDKKRHVFLLNGSEGLDSNKFLKIVGSPKLSELVEAEKPMTHQEAEDIVNNLIRSGTSLTLPGYGNTAVGVSIEPIEEKAFSEVTEYTTYDAVLKMLVEKNPQHKDNLYYLIHYLSPGHYYADVQGQTVVVPLSEWESKVNAAPGGSGHYPNHHTLTHWTFRMPVLDPTKFAKREFEIQTIQVRNPNYRPYWGNGQYDTTQVTVDIDVTQDVMPDLMRFKMVATTAAGNELSWYR